MAVSRGALATVLLVGALPVALAQDITVTDQADETVLFQADAVVREGADDPIIATGNVRASYGGRYLTADRVIYDPVEDLVTARGNVVLYEADGTPAFADEIVLTGDLGDGVATGFSALLANDNRLAAASAVRRRSGVNDLNRAVYTACEVCTEEGDAKTPTWAIRALRVTQDQNAKTIRFRNAVVEVLGVPVFYTPYAEIPDPSVRRKSGFLTPNVGTSTRLGLEVEAPYYWSISPHQDVTFSPRHMTELGTLIKGEYRVRTRNGGLTVQAGFIDPADGQDLEERRAFGTRDALAPEGFRADENLRWHLFAAAFRDLDDDWTAALDVNLTSDDAYLQFYDVEPEDQLRDALDVIKPDRLTTELSLTRRRADSLTDISAITFQSLRTTDDDDFQANALPRFTHLRRYETLGGQLEVLGNLLYLNRNQGLDTSRAVGAATFERTRTTRGGHRLRGFAQLRGDVYRFEDADLGVEDCNVRDANYDTCRALLPRDGEDDGFTTTRLLPTVGAEWSYPLARLTDTATFIIEPRAQLVLSPNEDFTRDVFNEDSQFFQFDDVTLFDWSKATGFDRWEDGARLNYGVSATAVYETGWTLSGLIGQQLRADDTNAFSTPTLTTDAQGNTARAFINDTGLGETASDIVGTFALRYGRTLSVDNRFRFDKEDGTLNRGESTVRANLGRFSTNLAYLRAETQERIVGGARDEFLTASAAYRLTDRWTVGAGQRENLATGETTSQSLLLRYDDQCTIFTVSYRFDNTVGRGVDTNRSLTFNVDLAGF